MPLFGIHDGALASVEQTNFATEKQLQRLVEANLRVIFNCRLIASEFMTGTQHSGRIDTLALSEDNNPVIIEYKKVESSELINQSLFYLAWLSDHRGDFELAVQKALGSNVEVDWSDMRVICIAPNYRKYDLHAVQVMGANIELWSYRLFSNDCLYLEEVFQKSYAPSSAPSGKDPIMVAAGKKAAQTRMTATYTLEEHFQGKPTNIKELALAVDDFITGLDSSIEQVPKKFYVAYRISQNIVCMELQRRKILLYLKLDPKDFERLPEIARDVTTIGHYGTGDFEVSLSNGDDLEVAKPYIEKAYQKVGG